VTVGAQGCPAKFRKSPRCRQWIARENVEEVIEFSGRGELHFDAVEFYEQLNPTSARNWARERRVELLGIRPIVCVEMAVDPERKGGRRVLFQINDGGFLHSNSIGKAGRYLSAPNPHPTRSALRTSSHRSSGNAAMTAPSPNAARARCG